MNGSLYNRERNAAHRLRVDIRDVANALMIIHRITGKVPVTISQLLGWTVEEFVEFFQMQLEQHGVEMDYALTEADAVRYLEKHDLTLAKYTAGGADRKRRLSEMIGALPRGAVLTESGDMKKVKDLSLLRELEVGAQEVRAESAPEGVNKKPKKEEEDDV